MAIHHRGFMKQNFSSFSIYKTPGITRNVRPLENNPKKAIKFFHNTLPTTRSSPRLTTVKSSKKTTQMMMNERVRM